MSDYQTSQQLLTALEGPMSDVQTPGIAMDVSSGLPGFANIFGQSLVTAPDLSTLLAPQSTTGATTAPMTDVTSIVQPSASYYSGVIPNIADTSALTGTDYVGSDVTSALASTPSIPWYVWAGGAVLLFLLLKDM